MTIRFVFASALMAAIVVPLPAPAANERFEDPMFRRCIDWMVDGRGGALIENICIDEYELPSSSLALCAKKVRSGFRSEADQEGCALVFEDYARQVRAGFVR